MSRTVCRFWQQGNCRYGDNCKFDHPGARTQPSSNRFSALSSANQTQMGSQRTPEIPYNLSKDIVRRDLAEDRPPWLLSCYGPGKDAPEQLFGGYPREQSFEEIRLHFMKGQLAGNPQGALNEIEALHQSAQQQIQTALGNLDGAIQYIVDAGNKHPNRIDTCAQGTPPGGTAGVFAVGRQQPSAFGAPSSSFGNQPNAFSSAGAQKPAAFGAPSAPTSSAFGQPSAMGQRPSAFGAPSFGQPSQPGPATGAFGKPSQPASAFGQPSAFGAKPSGFGAPAFGQAAQPTQSAGGSAFGQPSQPGSGSAFGQPSQPGATSAFGQPSQLGSASAFGKPSQLGSTPAFGQPSQPSSAFGQPSGLGQKPSPFSATATNSTPFSSSGNAFGQPSQPQQQPQQQQQQQNTNPFGAQPTQAAGGGFGQPSASNPFAKPSPAAANPFGQPQQPNANPFGSGAGTTNNMDTATNGTAEKPSPFGAPTATTGDAARNPFQMGAPSAPAASTPSAATGQAQSPYAPTASRQHPPIESYSAQEPDGRLRMFKGKAVTYELPKNGGDKEVPVIRNFDGSSTRIWFPNGAPPYNQDTEGAAGGGYDEKTSARWNAFAQTGRFEDGVMPEVPPMREFCTWDF